MLSSYNRKQLKKEGDFSNITVWQACNELSGLDWNYFIAPYIDRDLHEKLLPFDSSLWNNFIPILTLIRSGYFDTARTLIENTEFDSSLDEIKAWLTTTLRSANDVV